MPAPQHVNRQTFLANLRQSGLLDDKQLSQVASQLPDSNRGRVLARALVGEGLLTKFQAERLLAGRTNGFLLGQYRILDQLGQGGMGRVFKAEHRAMSRIVALKVLAPQLLKTDRAQELFLREVRAVARLVHPNIVTAYDANQVGDRYYLVLEYVDGPNLDQLVRAQGPLPVDQACHFIRQIADGLQYAFQMGLVHRDIKPANLLVQRSAVDGQLTAGAVKISDFGLARLQDSNSRAEDSVGTIVTRANTVMGTPDFLSPEQARSLHKADIRSDLYSLGCTFYFLLTGQVPFPGGSTLEKLVRQSTEQPTPIEELRPEVPAEVVAIVRRLMAKDPAARFQTPAELSNALSPFAGAGPHLWTTPLPSSVLFDDPLATPTGEGAALSDVAFDAATGDEACALVSTLTPDLSPTPFPDMSLAAVSRFLAPVARIQNKQFKIALLWGLSIVGGLMAVIALLSLLI